MRKKFNKKRSFQKKPKEFLEEVIQIDRVTRVVKGGRKLRFRATVVIGNKKSKVGVGVGKSHEVTGAIQKAIAKAKKNMIQVKLDGNTIPHDIKVNHKSSKIVFLPAAPGTGIIAGGPIRKVLDLAGVKDILSKSYGTTNKINNTRATYLALSRLRVTPKMEMESKKKKKNTKSNEKVKVEKKEAKKPSKKASNKTTAKKTDDKKSKKEEKTK